MLKRIAFIIFLISVLALTANAQEGGRFGMGFVVGDPTGFAWKYRMDNIHAIDGSIGFSPTERLRLQGDYLWHAYPFSEKRLALYYGPGIAFSFGRTDYVVFSNGYGYNDAGFGIRGVVGLGYNIKNSPVELFFEMAPLIVLTPTAGSGIDLGLGVRVYP